MNSPSHLRVRAKICGITTRQDAEEAIAAGADALGFNTWPGTPRYVDLRQAADWISELPPFVTKVALLVNAPIEEAERIAKLPFIDAIQLHGDEDPGYCRQVARTGRPFIKALRLRSEDDFSQISEYSTRQFLIDAYRPGSFGGTGALADLALAAEFRRRHPELHVVLAGGLNPENVEAAIRAVLPYAVDVSSGVENAPGKKDAGRMQAFVRAVRDALAGA